MSPEQCEGSAGVDQRADVYALGICLYEMLVGRVPFVGESYGEVLVQHLTQAPIAPSHYRLLPAHVEQVVVKALEKRPELRYPTMDEFSRALADPISYVETHGGLGEFLSRELAVSSTPVPRRMPTLHSLPNSLSGPSFPNPLQLSMHGTGPVPATAAPISGAIKQPSSGSRAVGIAAACAIVAAGFGAGLFWLRHSRRAAHPSGPVTDIVMSSSSSSTDNAPTATPLRAADRALPSQGSGERNPPGKTESSDTLDKSLSKASSARGDMAKAPVPLISGGAVSARPEPMVSLQVNSNPEGAQIFLNSRDTGRTTYAKLQFPRSKKYATITLRLKGYEDFVIPRFALDRDEITKSVTLKPTVTKPSPGRDSSGSVPQNSSNASPCDTCLERPD